MFSPLKQAARVLFMDDLRLRHDEDGLRLSFESGPSGAPSAAQRARAEAERLEREALARMADELAAVLQEHSGAPRRVRELLHVHRSLLSQGLVTLESMPLGSLRIALDQLEGAVSNWSPTGLACLRSKMAVGVQQRSARGESDTELEIGALAQVVAAREARTAVVQAQLEGGAPAVAVRAQSPDDDAAALLAAYSALQAPADGGNPVSSTR